MIGITRYGAYIPKYRLAREVIAHAWGSRFLTGERAVANHDEDSITMATEAAIHCLSGINPRTVDALFFASTTSPYLEKQASTLVATAADLSAEVFTADYSSSLRAGTAAIKAALDALNGGGSQNILVGSADSRRSEPGSDSEQFCGDGAAALLMGKIGVGAALASLLAWLGATVGMVLANGLAVLVGHTAGRRVPKKLMKRISGALFIGFGIWTLVEALV